MVRGEGAGAREEGAGEGGADGGEAWERGNGMGDVERGMRAGRREGKRKTEQTRGQAEWVEEPLTRRRNSRIREVDAPGRGPDTHHRASEPGWELLLK